MIRRCFRCQTNKPASEFYTGGNPWCRPCTRIYMQQVKLERRNSNREYVWNYLLAHACMDCGESDTVVLEFDHARGGKGRGGVSRMIQEGAALDTLKAEVAKCDVVCCNCHRRRTAQRAGHYRVSVSTGLSTEAGNPQGNPQAPVSVE